MPRMSSAARDAARQVQVIAADASNGAALAARLLAALEPAVGFDDAEVIAVDPDSLLFTRLLAYRGDRLPHFAFFLRDVYLVAREPDWLSFPRLLREGGGAAVFHERFKLWLRAHPPAMTQSAFTAWWRAQQSPPGGGLRFGLAHRGNWVAVLQLARWTPGPGFSASHLDLLDRLAPTLGLAFARTLAGTSDASASRDTPAAGHMTFSQDRRLVAIDSSGDAWLERLPDDGLRRFGVDVPIAVQSVVNLLWATGNPSAVSHVADRFGINVTIQGERARSVGPESAAGGALFSLSLTRTAWGRAHPVFRMLSSRQRDVAVAVAEGLSDAAIAAQMGVGAATIHERVQTLHRVLGTSTRPALVAALSRG